MTALKDFDRLESQGVWQAAPDAQRRDVIVSVGKATLTLSDNQETAIAHWSLPAIERINPAQRPAQFRPGPDASDILELTDDTMIVAISKVHKAIRKRRPRPGRLRYGLTSGGAALVAAFAIFWLPGAMIAYTASVVPDSKREEIGMRLLKNIGRVAGTPCNDILGVQALKMLQTRLFGSERNQIFILSDHFGNTRHLPGDILLLDRALVEDHEEVDVAAGFLLVEMLRARANDPLVRMLQEIGFSGAFRFLTTGDISEPALAHYAEKFIIAQPATVSEQAILDQLRNAQVRASPYAYAVDISGETTISLIEADPTDVSNYAAILDDAAWVGLQGICGE